MVDSEGDGRRWTTVIWGTQDPCLSLSFKRTVYSGVHSISGRAASFGTECLEKKNEQDE